MTKILKYLKDSRLSALAILALLVVQALCDLALPQYTADIVDIGIGQQGIDSVAPQKMRAETLDKLSLLLQKEEAAAVEAAYTLDEDGIYILNTDEAETIKELEEILAAPMALLSA